MRNPSLSHTHARPDNPVDVHGRPSWLWPCFVSVALASCLSCSTESSRVTNPLSPPLAEKIAHTSVVHGQTLTDDYFWLRDKDNPKVPDELLTV